jgi:hypothetical protein
VTTIAGSALLSYHDPDNKLSPLTIHKVSRGLTWFSGRLRYRKFRLKLDGNRDKDGI